MWKIHHDPRYPYQDGEVPHVEKGPKVSCKIQKEEGIPQDKNMQTEDDASETDVPTGQGFRYPPQIFTNLTYTTTVTYTESEGEVELKRKFLGKYCNFCDRYGKTHSWCNSFDWEEGLINVDDPNSNPSIERIPSPTVGRPPVGWSTFRCRIIREADQARPPLLPEVASTDSGISMQ